MKIIDIIPQRMSATAGIQMLRLSKHSPKILFGVGVVGVVGGAVLACRATLKLEEEVLEPAQKQLVYANTKTEKAHIQLEANLKLAKLYLPALVVGGVGIACLTKSHNILTQRNAALAAAYTTVTQALETYRARVVTELGEEKDREFFYGAESREIVVDTKNGPKIETVRSHVGASGYARVFGQTNPCYQYGEPMLNKIFLEGQQMAANRRLDRYGWLCLNDVYEMLGFERTAAGQQVGWVKGPNGKDGQIDFGVGDWPNAADFVHGREGGTLLDFNVDGVILDLIDKVRG